MANLQPINNIYIIPIKDISFLECLDGVATGHQETTTLAEGNNKTNARLSLTQYPGFHKNWINLAPEHKKRIQPFKLNRRGLIEPVLYCDRRFKNNSDDYTCGMPVHDIEGHEDQYDKSVR